MPNIMVTWLPKACRTPAVRKQVAAAIIKACVSVKDAEITADKVVVRFGEACDGWPLPAGHTYANVNEPPKEEKK
eukprot:CAMPEP_0206233030 /NCGR_PEP_ID=MMETSP0047_2-20121206/11752_1 /ASSEMBLY_ACC=CAM_ASM_000192 /TAXON_ID=195065 /ORGANISM="Chroomonas mesostigmatica_cf, Strain CCMP1168" /LENGTH=74 /DNA_ID=CAMNT_0053656847 /DNA_START=87 /DNA_END=311 /DNA_ORIENTATION=+